MPVAKILKLGGMVISFLLILWVGWVVGWIYLHPESDLAPPPNLEPGDILFQENGDKWGPWGYWNHVGLYVGDGMVVESWMSKGVVRRTLRNFYTDSQKVAVKRLATGEDKWWNKEGKREEIIAGAIRYAQNQVGKPYQLWPPVGKNHDDSELNCGRLILLAYYHEPTRYINLDSNSDWLWTTPDDIYTSPCLEEVPCLEGIS